jgi:predicted DNA-binding transcriptional regulator YafY
MRADRLLALIMLLQSRGKQTAKLLAQELGVSQRTILRDVDALSLAGVPIYSEGGHGGGIALDEKYRTTLNGLHTPEVQALFISENRAVLHDVGLKDAAEKLLLKLFAALPDGQRLTVDHIRQRLMIDPTWWWHEANPAPFWNDLQRAVYEDRVIQATYENYEGERMVRVLEPYSLVSKSSLWYLVARREGDLRIYRVSRLHDLQVLDQRFVRAREFDLQHYWHTHLEQFKDSFSDYRCILRVQAERVTFVQWLLPGRCHIVHEADRRGWVTLHLMMDTSQMAEMLVFGLGTAAEVVSPPELTTAVLSGARTLVEHLSAEQG